MKTLLSLLFSTFLFVGVAMATDTSIVSNWKFPIEYWYPQTASISVPAGGVDNYPRAQALADSIGDFDPAGVNFDAVWTQLNKQGDSGAGYPIAHTTGNPLSDKGAADFTGAWKAVYDQNNIYILIKYTDDAIKGNETVELMWAPYLSIPAIAALPAASLPNCVVQAPYARYAQFGGYKVSYSATGISGAMIVDFSATGVGKINWSGTDAVLTSALSFDNKTELGSKTIKAIYTIGFQALTGNAYSAALNARPTFNNSVWRALNEGKGISFDIKVSDTDPDDQLNTAVPPVEKPQEYWWNTTSNDGYAMTYYSGFLGVRKTISAVNQVYSNRRSIFGEVTSNSVHLNQTANVEVYNSIGKLVLKSDNVNVVELKGMKEGMYIVKANDEVLKVRHQ